MRRIDLHGQRENPEEFLGAPVPIQKSSTRGMCPGYSFACDEQPAWLDPDLKFAGAKASNLRVDHQDTVQLSSFDVGAVEQLSFCAAPVINVMTWHSTSILK